MAQSKDSLDQWLAVIVAGAPTTRTFTAMSPTSHYGQWHRMSFKISSEGRQSLSQHAEDQKSKVSSLTPHYLYHRRKLKLQFITHTRDNVWRARHFGLFAIQAMQRPTHCEWGPNPYDNDIDPPNKVRQQGRRPIMPMTVEGARVFLFRQQRDPNKPMVWPNSTRTT
jgi:hypothetical protein